MLCCAPPFGCRIARNRFMVLVRATGIEKARAVEVSLIGPW
jgi:hypothetical protein